MREISFMFLLRRLADILSSLHSFAKYSSRDLLVPSQKYISVFSSAENYMDQLLPSKEAKILGFDGRRRRCFIRIGNGFGWWRIMALQLVGDLFQQGFRCGSRTFGLFSHFYQTGIRNAVQSCRRNERGRWYFRDRNKIPVNENGVERVATMEREMGSY